MIGFWTMYKHVRSMSRHTTHMYINKIPRRRMRREPGARRESASGYGDVFSYEHKHYPISHTLGTQATPITDSALHPVRVPRSHATLAPPSKTHILTCCSCVFLACVFLLSRALFLSVTCSHGVRIDRSWRRRRRRRRVSVI